MSAEFLVVEIVKVESKSLLVRAERRLHCSECQQPIKLHTYFMIVNRYPVCYECAKSLGLVGS